MGTNSSLSNILLLATVSSSVISMNCDFESSIPKMNYQYQHELGVADWKDNAFNKSSDYQLQNDYLIKIQTILNFSEKVLVNSKDIDVEFVDIVNENFWELI